MLKQNFEGIYSQQSFPFLMLLWHVTVYNIMFVKNTDCLLLYFWWNIIMVAGINIICLQYVVMNHWCREGLGGNTLRHDVMTAPVNTVWGLFQENFYLNSTQFIF